MTIPLRGTFERNLMISGIGHAVLVVIIFFRAVLVPSEAIEIRRAIRVDVVDLPAKVTEPVQLPAPAAEPAAPPIKDLPAKAEPKPEPKVQLKPVKEKKVDLSKKQNKALDKIKAMAALDKIKNEVSEQKKSDKASQQIRGNQVSAGNSLTGLDKIEFDRYFDELHQKILSSWSIPQWLADAPLKAQVQILIDDKGVVFKKTLLKSSGNSIFDGKVMEAVDASSPLPAPPGRLQGKLSTSGIILNFPE